MERKDTRRERKVTSGWRNASFLPNFPFRGGQRQAGETMRQTDGREVSSNGVEGDERRRSTGSSVRARGGDSRETEGHRGTGRGRADWEGDFGGRRARGAAKPRDTQASGSARWAGPRALPSRARQAADGGLPPGDRGGLGLHVVPAGKA